MQVYSMRPLNENKIQHGICYQKRCLHVRTSLLRSIFLCILNTMHQSFVKLFHHAPHSAYKTWLRCTGTSLFFFQFSTGDIFCALLFAFLSNKGEIRNYSYSKECIQQEQILSFGSQSSLRRKAKVAEIFQL